MDKEDFIREIKKLSLWQKYIILYWNYFDKIKAEKFFFMLYITKDAIFSYDKARLAK